MIPILDLVIAAFNTIRWFIAVLLLLASFFAWAGLIAWLVMTRGRITQTIQTGLEYLSVGSVTLYGAGWIWGWW